MESDKKELNKASVEPMTAERQADLHWQYVGGVLRAHGINDDEISRARSHYRSAFIHGWKHGQEAMNAKANS